MSLTQAELNELLGIYSAENAQKSAQDQKQTKRAAVQQSSIADTFESAAKSIIGDDAATFLSRSGGAVLRGAKSGVAGLLTLPYELPALAEAGIEYGAQQMGYDVDVPFGLTPGKAYGGLAELTGATLPEDATEAEKALYYGMESLPMLGGGGLFRMAGRGVQGAIAGNVAEDNALLGMAIGAAPEIPKVPGFSRGGMPTTKVDAVDDEAAQLGQDLANTYGVEETRGQMLYRAAMQETNPELRMTKVAEAERVLALEEAGRRYAPEGKEGVRSNVALWRENDAKQAQQIEDAMRKIANVGKGAKKPVDVKKKLVSAYNSWAKKRMENFRKANADDFGKLDRGIKFDLSNVVDEIDAIVEKYSLGTRLQEAPQNTLLKIRRKLISEKGDIKELSAPEVQAILQDLGQLAWKGSIAGLDDLNPGVAKSVAREMIGVFDSALDNLANTSAELTGQQAQLLQDARFNYKARVTALKNESSGALMEFFKLDPASSTPDAIVRKIESVSDDPDQVRIFSSLIQEELPDLWPDVKQVLFDREIAKLADSAGFLDVQKLQQARSKLLENQVLFGDASASKGLNELGSFLDSLEGIFARLDPQEFANLGAGNLYSKLKLGSEIGGSIGGPKPRYVGEAITKLALMFKGNRIPAEAAAYVASNPGAVQVMKKALAGKANALTAKEMNELRTLVQLGRIQTFTAIPAIYFSRDDSDSTRETAEFIQGLFSSDEEQ